MKNIMEKNSIKIPQLCVPAGNLKILKYACVYGADAVYIGGGKYNLRNYSDNFSIEELEEAVDFAHKSQKKIYFTLNSLIDEDEIKDFKDYINQIKKIDFDAIIVSDAGALSIIKEIIPGMRAHISTQTSTMNSYAVNFWAAHGACRVNLARELSYESIKSICQDTDIEIEVFVHGALCISYSGRCMLSKYLSGRDANKGQCSHTCRWKYYLMEEKRPNTFYPIEQDKRGTYIYNSRDLCLLEKLDLITFAGVDSIKIEGRMKTESYVSLVTWVYRKALDLIKSQKFHEREKEYLLSQLDKSTHRGFTQGFMFAEDSKGRGLTENDNAGYFKNYRFAGSIEGYDKKNNGPLVRARNQVKKGSLIDILQPGKDPEEFLLQEIIKTDKRVESTGETVEVVNTNDLFIIPGIGRLDDYALIKVRAKTGK